MKSNCIKAFEHIKNNRFNDDSGKRRIYFTLHNEKTGNHRTFRIEKSPANAKFAANSLIIGLLVGAENNCESSYKTFGFVNDTDVFTWKKYKNTNFEKLGQIVSATLLENPKYTVPETLKIIPSGRCYMCGRPLTTPESIQAGIGPICLENL